MSLDKPWTFGKYFLRQDSVICLDFVLRTSIDLIKENGFTLKKRQGAGYTPEKLLWMPTMQIT